MLEISYNDFAIACALAASLGVLLGVVIGSFVISYHDKEDN